MSEIKQPSVAKRDALRAFVRSHPQWDRNDPAQDVARIIMADLKALVVRLGGDVEAIEASALAGAPAAPAAPAVVLAPAAAAAPAGDVLAQLEALKTDLVEGGFGSIRGKLAAMIEAAQKPPQIVEKIVYQPAPERLAPGAHDLKPARASTWGELFGVAGRNAGRPITVWDHPRAPKSNKAYVFPADETAMALSQMARSEAARLAGAPAKHVLFFGPAGTGKTAWAEEFAARTGRPFVCISMSDGLEIDQLLGQRVLDGKGGVTWADGVLLGAIRQPGMVVCLDEIGGMRPAVGLALNNLLQHMEFFIPDTGELVKVARGVCFVATNNATLADSGAAKGYVGVQRQNAAFADRFGVAIELNYAPERVEAGLLCTYTGCTQALADLLVSVATLSRAKAASDDLVRGIGFRRLLAWAECLTDGNSPEASFRAAVLSSTPSQDQETIRQIALIAIDPNAIRRAMNPSQGA